MKLGDEIKLTIWDHCKGPGTIKVPMEFNVYGKVVAIDANSVILASWIDPAGTVDDNTEVFAIVRSAIRKVKVLK